MYRAPGTPHFVRCHLSQWRAVPTAVVRWSNRLLQRERQQLKPPRLSPDVARMRVTPAYEYVRTMSLALRVGAATSLSAPRQRKIIVYTSSNRTHGLTVSMPLDVCSARAICVTCVQRAYIERHASKVQRAKGCPCCCCARFPEAIVYQQSDKRCILPILHRLS